MFFVDRARISILLLLVSTFSVRIQAALDPGRELSQYVQKSWSAEQGLPENSVTSSAQTADGYLWFGTEGGLARFDGFRFSTFDKSNTPELQNNFISAVLADHNQNLWVGTHGGGLACFRHGHFEKFAQQEELARYLVLSLFEDRHGTLWIGTQGNGLLALHAGKLRKFTARDGLPNDSVFAIMADRQGEIWIGTQDGLGHFAGGHWSSPSSLAGLGTNEVRSLCLDKNGSVLVGTHGNGLFRYDGSHFAKIRGLTDISISTLYTDSAGTVWIGTLAGGLNRLTPDGHVDALTKKDGLPGEGVWSIFEDRSGTLWLGSTDGGLSSLRDGTFMSLTPRQGLTSDTTLAIFQDKAGNVWIGSDQGLTRWTDGRATRFTTASGLPDNLVLSVAEDGAGDLWVGTRNGLARLRNGRFQKMTAADGLPDARSFLCTYTDRHGTLWVGTRSGLSRYDGKRFSTYSGAKTVGDKPVISLYQDVADRLWIGTDGGGLISLTAGHFRTFTTRQGLGSDVIYSITGDSDGTLWLGTNGGGLTRWARGKFINYAKKDGLIDDAIFQVLDDQRGNLWMSSNRGIASVRRQDLKAFASGHKNRIRSTVYGLADGMKSAECNGGFQPAGWRTRDGRLWFPTLKGAAIASPGLTQEFGMPASLVVESVRVGDKPIPITDDLTIPPGQKHLAFDFTAPGASAPEKLTFRYTLENFDKDWVDADQGRTAYYTNIPAGTYRFRAEACLQERCVESKVGLPITLQPSFYETKVFFCLVAGLACGLGFAFHRLNVRKLKQGERRLKRLVDDRTRELRESRDQLEVRVAQRTNDLSLANRRLAEEVAVRRVAEQRAEAASTAKSQFLSNMSHELRTPINGIMGMTELAISTELDAEQLDYLTTIKRSADSLLALVVNILDFTKIEADAIQTLMTPFQVSECIDKVMHSISERARQQGLEMQVTIAPDVPDLLIGDSDHLSQVLLILLDNSLKYTSKGRIQVDVSVQEPSLVAPVLHFSVSDTGIGISKDQHGAIFEAFAQADNSSTRQFGGGGLGLAIAARLVRLLQGRIWVESEPAAGSIFHFLACFQLPVAAR